MKEHFGNDFCNSPPMEYTDNSSFLKLLNPLFGICLCQLAIKVMQHIQISKWSRNRHICTLIDQHNVKTYHRIFKTCLVILNMF